MQHNVNNSPNLGQEIQDRLQTLAAHSESPWAEQGQLTVTYMTDAHRACANTLREWMIDAGFDSVSVDAVGNVVGRYHPPRPGARYLLTGSHYDTVRNGGKYDGRLGILVPLVCVRELHRQGRRLPFGIELVAFAEEEGQRYNATFLGSSALTGQFDPAWLAQRDGDGISMREAITQAGLDPDALPQLRRNPDDYLGFLEIHIEQGPVLFELDLPLGVVTAINGSVRYRCDMTGQASHAGTTPMDRRRDAACGVAELALHVEARARQDGDSVGTVGELQVPGGSINVVPGRCTFTLDLRAPSDAQRDALAADVLAAMQEIATRRGLHCRAECLMTAPAAPCDAGLQQRWAEAITSLGLPVHRMPSGAGHDAMKLHDIMPQAMLFVRGQHGGISHNPLEFTTSDDMRLAALAFSHVLEQLAGESTVGDGSGSPPPRASAPAPRARPPRTA